MNPARDNSLIGVNRAVSMNPRPPAPQDREEKIRA
jgi:hypothetical protein